ncbi:MAG: phosphatase PAP2 family protein [Actinomycetota bacterium]
MLRGRLRAAGLLGAAVAVGVASSGGRGANLDERAFAAVNRGHGASADRLFSGITELGSIWASIGAAAALGTAGRRRAAARGLAAASLAWLAGQGLKKVFLRRRPYVADPDGVRLMVGPPRATSWPSSHPAVLLAFLTVAGRELSLSSGARAALTGLGAAVGVSRVYVGVHYPADVVGGLLLGRAVAEAVSGNDR